MNKKLALVLLAGTVLLLLNGYARANVRDNAGLFGEDTVRQANERIAKLGVPVVVETYGALPDAMLQNYNPQRKDESFAAYSKQRVQQVAPDGVYVLVTTNPNYVSVTEGTKNVIRGADTNAVRNAMVHSFGAKNFDEGLLRGLDALSTSTGLRNAAPGAAAVEGTPQAQTGQARSDQRSSPQATPTDTSRRTSRGPSLLSLIIWGVILFIMFRLIRGFFARRMASQQPGANYGNHPQHPNAPVNDPYNQGGYGRPGVGGFGAGLGGGLLGGMLGGMLGGHLFGRGGSAHANPNDANSAAGTDGGGAVAGDQDREFASSGGTFGDDVGGGGDFGGGGDIGGGGGDFSGGDF